MTQWGLDNLFNPGKRHMDDEKRRLQSTREEVGDNSGGRRIDLEGGKVSIALPRPAAAVTPTSGEAEAMDATPVDVDAAPTTVDEPVLALSNDDAEIEPAVEAEPEDVPDDEAPPSAPRRRLSADAWSRRG